MPATVLDEIAVLMDVHNEGNSEANSSRSWQRRIQRDIPMPKLYYASIPVSSGSCLHPFRLPSVKARQLWQNDPHHFELKHQERPGRVEHSGNRRQHPLFRAAGLKAIPMTFYGDGVQYVVGKHGKQDSLMCLYYAFPHRLPAQVGAHDDENVWMQDIHVFTVLRKKDMTAETFDAVWDVLVRDMKAMLAGRFPKTRHDGTVPQHGEYLHATQDQIIAGGYKFAIVPR